MAIKKYGIIAGNAEIMEIRKMGVDDPNIWNVANRLRLIEQLRQGDSLCVVRLSSMCTGARDVYNMLDCLVRKRVCFQSQNERYLNFSNKSPLNRTRQQFLYTMALRELWWMKTIYHLNAKP